MCIATCTHVALLLFTASATRWPGPLDNTQESFAVPWRLLGGVPSSDFSVALAGAGRGIQEVPLEVSRTSAVYRGQLGDAYALLKLWVSTSKWSTTAWTEVPATAAQVLCEHVQWLRDSGRTLGNARHAVLAAQTIHRPLRGHISRAWDCTKSWQLQHPLRSRVPMPHAILQAFFLMAVSMALSAVATRDILRNFAFAVLTRIGHHCLLRPGEMMKLLVCDVRLPAGAHEPEVAVLRLRDPKNRASLGRFQFAIVRDVALVRWLAWFIDDCPQDMKLWPADGRAYAEHFRLVLRRLGLARLPLTPGCLRPGGATLAFLEGSSVSQLKYQGRWRVESSLEVYIQEAMAHLCVCELSSHEHGDLAHMLQQGAAQWCGPPASHWSTFFSRAAQWRGLASKRARALLEMPKPQPVSSTSRR